MPLFTVSVVFVSRICDVFLVSSKPLNWCEDSYTLEHRDISVIRLLKCPSECITSNIYSVHIKHSIKETKSEYGT